ncbi:MAG: hypothetical protein ACRCZF_09610, partial [Gemmataceae bacterium]
MLSRHSGHLPPVEIAIEQAVGPAILRWDSGYGFSSDQEFVVPAGAPLRHAIRVRKLLGVQIQIPAGVVVREGIIHAGQRTVVHTVYTPAGDGCWESRGFSLSDLMIPNDRLRTAVRVATATILGGIVMLLFTQRQALLNGLHGQRRFWSWFVLYLVLLSSWAIALSPGFLVADSMQPGRAAEESKPDLWFSAAYSVTLLALAQFGPIQEVLCIVQSLGFALLLAAFTTDATRFDRYTAVKIGTVVWC